MIKKTSRQTKILIGLFSVIAFILQPLFAFFYANPNTKVFAEDVLGKSSEEISIDNGKFNSSSSASLQTSPYGWTKIESDSTLKAGVITVADQKTFENNSESYGLSNNENPSKFGGDVNDNKVLMINSENATTNFGFKSSPITLTPNSFYVFNIKMKTMNESVGSIYLSGLSEKYTVANSFIAEPSHNWANGQFYIFVKTGIETKTTNIELWLGSKDSVKSSGAVFFDNIDLFKTSDKTFTDLKKSTTLKREFDLSSETKNISDQIVNGDFEDSTNLTLIPSSTTATGKIISTNTNEKYDDLTSLNNFLFTIKNETQSYSAYKTSPITIKQHGIYKLAFNAKIIDDLIGEGSFEITLTEGNDVKDIESEYTPKTETFSEIKSNQSNKFNNNFNNYSFIIKGNPLYDTTVSLEFKLGNNNKKVKGEIAINNISLESINFKQFNSLTAGTLVKKVEFAVATASPVIKNGHFNDAEIEDYLTNTTKFPIKPADWTQQIKDTTSKDDYIFGIINTKEGIYNHTDLGISNPLNPNKYGSISTTSNNMLMLANKARISQSIKSTNFSLTSSEGKASIYEITFDIKTIIESGAISASLYMSDGTILGTIKNIDNSEWNTNDYKFVIKTKQEDLSCYIQFDFGTKTDAAKGYAFIDNVFQNDITSATSTEEYLALLKNTSKSLSVVDLVDGSWNLKSETPNENGVYQSHSFDSILATDANFGVISGIGNNFDVTSEGTAPFNNILMLENNANGKSVLTSKFASKFEVSKFYKVSMRILTRNIKEDNDDKSKREYGVSIELDGLTEKFSNIKTTKNNEFETYTFYLTPSQTISSKLKFTFLSDDNTTSIGQLFVDNLKITDITEATFKQDTDGLDKNPKNNVLKVGEVKVDEPANPDNSGMTSDEKWLLIPSIILAVVTIVALIAFAIRRIKVKKYETLNNESYDRASSLEKEVLKREAKSRIDQKLAVLESEKASITKEMDEDEKDYQEKLSSHRNETANETTDAKAKTQNIEKTFKQYASKRARQSGRIDKLNDKISDISSVENLLIEERKIALEKKKLEQTSKKNSLKLIKENKTKEQKAKTKKDD